MKGYTKNFIRIYHGLLSSVVQTAIAIWAVQKGYDKLAIFAVASMGFCLFVRWFSSVCIVQVGNCYYVRRGWKIEKFNSVEEAVKHTLTKIA